MFDYVEERFNAIITGIRLSEEYIRVYIRSYVDKISLNLSVNFNKQQCIDKTCYNVC